MSSSQDYPRFDAYYFAHDCGTPYQRNDLWLDFFASIAERILRDIQPRTVLDAGCAFGFLVEQLRQRGVQAWGVDISEYAIQNVHPSIQTYCWVGSISQPLPQKYDLIVSIEVLEHLPKEASEKAIANLCQYSEDILFSSTPFDYKEATHLNVQTPEYWAEQFARQGFFRDVDFDGSFITPWAVRFQRRNQPVHYLVRDYERRYWPVWKENVDLRQQVNAMADQLRQHENRLQSQEAQLLLARQRQAEPGSSPLRKLLSSLRLRLIPPQSRRERWFYALFNRGKQR